jgi:hypothetical protein
MIVTMPKMHPGPYVQSCGCKGHYDFDGEFIEEVHCPEHLPHCRSCRSYHSPPVDIFCELSPVKVPARFGLNEYERLESEWEKLVSV